MTPIIRWVGGKTRLLPAITEILGDRPIDNYYETFLGGGAVFFHLHERIRGESFLNDSNIDLIEAYNQIRTSPKGVCKHLDQLLGDNVPYDEIRREFNLRALGLQRKAALFLALNHLCFNGLWRVNKTGHMNTPIGKLGNNQPRTLANFPFVALDLGSKALRRATITAVPFEILAESPHSSLNKQVKSGDFVFFDPPYLDVFADYTKEGFGVFQHTLLAAQAQRCAAAGALVILCGSDTDASLDIYGEPRARVALKRTVGVSKRGEVHECLWVFGE